MENVLAIKQTTLSISLITIFTYLGIDAKVFGLYVTLLFIDFITWLIKGIKSKELSSRRAVNGFFSKFTILLLILSIWVFGKINNYDMSYILSGTFFALSLSEMYSIIWNTYEIRTGTKVKEYDAIAIILKKALLFVKSKLDNIDFNEKKQNGDDKN